MRHTKKLLALTLVLVMVAAFAVPAFAFDYKDDADIDPKYKEAIDTLYEMNVMRGSTSGNFDPKYTLSRGQMAMLMFIVDSGGNRDAKLWADASNNFTDIDGWFYTNHIKWAYAQGIVGGVTPTLFRPTNQLTAIEALGFALGLIGYNRNTEGFFGADWKNKILVCLNQYDNLFLLNKLDHLMGNLGDYITREETAQLIYNMLFVQRVEYDEGKAWPADITVGAWYFDDFYAGSGILLANNFAVIDSGSTVAEGSIRLDASTLIKADAPLAFFGREVNYVQPTGDAAMVFLANTDTVAATTVGAVKADMEKKPADATWDWSVTPLKYAKNYKSCTDTEFEAIKDDNPVTLVLKGKKVQFVLAMEYKFGQVSLETDGKVTVTGGGVKVLDKVAPADIVIGANLAVKDAMVLAAKLGNETKYALVAVEKLNGTCSEFVTNDFFKINGTNYNIAKIDNASMAGFAAGHLGKALDYYLFGGKLLGFVTPAGTDTKTTGIMGESTTLTFGKKYFVYDIASKSEKVYELVGDNKVYPPEDDFMKGITVGMPVELTFDSSGKLIDAVELDPVFIKEDYKLIDGDDEAVDNGFVELKEFLRKDNAGLKLALLTDGDDNEGLFNYDGIDVVELKLNTTSIGITVSELKDEEDPEDGTNANEALVYIDKGKVINAFIIS